MGFVEGTTSVPQRSAGVKASARPPAGGTGPRAAALRLLAIRPRSVAELADRLSAKGFSQGAVAAVTAELCAEGFLDDAAMARAVVESALARKPVGRQALAQKLRQYQVPPDIGERVLQELLPPERERGLARAAAQKKLAALRRSGPPPADPRLPARLFRFLRARGFSPDAIAAAVEER